MSRRVEIVAFPGATDTAVRALDALEASARAYVVTRSSAYVGGSPWLLCWGPGGEGRRAAMARQTAAGGHSIVLDLAYFDRVHQVRVSIDAPHPQAWVLRHDWPAARWEAMGLALEEQWDPAGPVIVAGIGRKARAQYGGEVATWEAAMIATCRARGWHVWYRQKQMDAPVPSGVPLTATGPIEDVLRGASLVITHHSNVAVDAIRMGLPVVCRDGAAAALCPAEIPTEVDPIPRILRLRFLQNLAWFQWNLRTEGSACWAWLETLLCAS